MKREIKFRQPVFNRDKTFKDWHYWGTSIEQEGEIVNAAWLSFKIDITNPIDSQQYTGLLDKNGKEIYEGDIVEGVWRGKNIDKDVFGVVDFTEGMFGIVNTIDGDSYSLNRLSVEVVGNICEHSHLLTGEGGDAG